MLSLFKIAGVYCTSGFADSDTYHSGVNPAFINSTDIAAFPFGGRCVGWKSVPSGSFDCGAVPKDSVTQRLCPCTCGMLCWLDFLIMLFQRHKITIESFTE